MAAVALVEMMRRYSLTEYGNVDRETAVSLVEAFSADKRLPDAMQRGVSHFVGTPRLRGTRMRCAFKVDGARGSLQHVVVMVNQVSDDTLHLSIAYAELECVVAGEVRAWRHKESALFGLIQDEWVTYECVPRAITEADIGQLRSELLDSRPDMHALTW